MSNIYFTQFIYTLKKLWYCIIKIYKNGLTKTQTYTKFQSDTQRVYFAIKDLPWTLFITVIDARVRLRQVISLSANSSECGVVYLTPQSALQANHGNCYPLGDGLLLLSPHVAVPVLILMKFNFVQQVEGILNYRAHGRQTFLLHDNLKVYWYINSLKNSLFSITKNCTMSIEKKMH